MTKQQKALRLLHAAYLAQMHGQVDKASTLYKQSLCIHPTAEAYTFLGWTCSLQGNLEQAIDLCQRAIETDPEFGNPYSDIGSYLIQLNRYQEATDWLRKAVRARRYTCFYSIHYNLGQIYESIGEEAKAIQAYRASMQNCPECVQSRGAYWRLIRRNN